MAMTEKYGQERLMNLLIGAIISSGYLQKFVNNANIGNII